MEYNLKMTLAIVAISYTVLFACSLIAFVY